MKDLMISVKKELSRYEREYNKSYGVPDLDKQHKQLVTEAATSYIEGVCAGVLYGFGAEAHDEFIDFIEDLDYDFIKGQAITGTAFA